MNVKYTPIFAQFWIVLLVPNRSLRICENTSDNVITLSMVLLACIVCASVKYIQYKTSFIKEQVHKDPKTALSHNRITYVIKIFRHVQPLYYKKQKTVPGFNHLSVKTLIQCCLRSE